MITRELELMALNADGSTRDDDARQVLADLYEEKGRHDDAAVVRMSSFEPPKVKGPKRGDVKQLKPHEIAALDPWAKEWQKLVSQPTKRLSLVERRLARLAVDACYQSINVVPPERVIWVADFVEVHEDVHNLRTIANEYSNCIDRLRADVNNYIDKRIKQVVRDKVGDRVYDPLYNSFVRKLASKKVSPGCELLNFSCLDLCPWDAAFVSFVQDVLRFALPSSMEKAARAYQTLCCFCWMILPCPDVAILIFRT